MTAKAFFLFIQIVLFCQFTNGQPRIQELATITKHNIDPPDLLVQGRFYHPSKPLANGHPFLGGDDFQDASIFIKDQNFNKIPIKIDIDLKQVILKYQIKDITKQILLSENSVDSIHVSNKTFISKSHLPNNYDFFFPQLIYSGKIMLINQFDKDFIARYDYQSPHGYYSKTQSRLFIIKNGIAHKLKRKKALIKFSENPKSLKDFLKNNGIKLRKSNDEELKIIMKYIENEQ